MKERFIALAENRSYHRYDPLDPYFDTNDCVPQLYQLTELEEMDAILASEIEATIFKLEMMNVVWGGSVMRICKLD